MEVKILLTQADLETLKAGRVVIVRHEVSYQPTLEVTVGLGQ